MINNKQPNHAPNTKFDGVGLSWAKNKLAIIAPMPSVIALSSTKSKKMIPVWQ
ncbi:hypothetical protein [Moraxella bovis]|uniref:Uncharacterized protein n=1 Tax=Moraxella bovis TaxID=476 RepID=A0AAQ2T2Y2_MORBO|nr:hypothetical protein [Moraxella bovis]UYZ68080.1 hypothetical protein LP122_09980 [Moraxella bovis]UYZ70461.1 hypothetical protein LP089_10125 [Moraxella bovis]UYZ73619.1 hypothetical protein LP105_02550 [Moraxella bovis]UYZ76256.1 hypothetical protein LP093_02735 [Moraxella bovis]UYZ77792.1 hypothetical protein LP115_11070 [Moraxella bovis]